MKDTTALWLFAMLGGAIWNGSIDSLIILLDTSWPVKILLCGFFFVWWVRLIQITTHGMKKKV
jgi:hypothetical protein